MIDDGIPGDNESRYRALLRIRALAKRRLDAAIFPCDHQWDGPRIPFGESGSIATCSRCGEAAIDLRLA